MRIELLKLIKIGIKKNEFWMNNRYDFSLISPETFMRVNWSTKGQLKK